MHVWGYEVARPAIGPLPRARREAARFPSLPHVSSRWARARLVAAEYRGGTFRCYVEKGAFSALHRRLLAKSLFASKGNRLIHYSLILIRLYGPARRHFWTTAIACKVFCHSHAAKGFGKFSVRSGSGHRCLRHAGRISGGAPTRHGLPRDYRAIAAR